MKRRLMSVLLVLCMAVSLLPGTALAAVGDLVRNSSSENKSLLEQLESFTGESYEEAYELLDSLGLLDEDGNLITDMAIVLDGVEYTLEEIEAMLNDPATDLTDVAEVDGVPISLGDLATIIAIERELQYLQDTYFTGRTFEGEALANVNSLLSQLQSKGLTLGSTRSTGNTILLNTTGEGNLLGEGYPCYYIATDSAIMPEVGTTFTVKFKLAVSDAVKKISDEGDIIVSLAKGDSARNQTVLTSQTINASAADPTTEYTLSYTVDSSWNDYKTLYLGVTYQMASFEEGGVGLDDLVNFTDCSFGTLSGGVTFYEPEGFLFADSSGNQLETWNTCFDYQFALPQLVDQWSNAEGATTNSGNMVGAITFLLVGLNQNESYEALRALDKTIQYLEDCKGGSSQLTDDTRQRFKISATLRQKNDLKQALMSSIELFNNSNYNTISIDLNSAYNFPINLPSSDTVTQSISFNAFNGSPGTSVSSLLYLPTYFNVFYCTNTTQTVYDEDCIVGVENADSQTSNVSIELVDDAVNSAPTLTVTAPAGNYQSGDLIPITITGDEFIQASANATITINSTRYSLSDLHASTSGKFISLLYKVKDVDAANLLISDVSGVTDFFDNAANTVNQTVAGVSLTSALMKNAVQSLTAGYANGAVSFGITANQDEAYKTVYGQYASTPTELMQLLISVDGAAAATHTVTMGEDPSDWTNFIFTADPYTIAPAAAAQTVTVQLQIRDGNDWLTVNRLTTTVTVPERKPVTEVTISVVNVPDDYDYTITIGDTYIPRLQAQVKPADASYTTGTWHSTDEAIATIDVTGQIHLTNTKVGEVSFYYVADNGTEDTNDDVKSNELKFTVSSGTGEPILTIPKYAQDSMIQSGSSATVTWDTNLFLLFPGSDVTFTVKLYAGTDTSVDPKMAYTVENPSTSTEKVSSYTIPAADLTAAYPQSQYTVVVSTETPAALSDSTTITVLAPPTQVRITADDTTIRDDESLTLTCAITGDPGAAGTLSVKRMANGTEANAAGCLSTSGPISGTQTVTFTPATVASGSLYDTYTITFKEDRQTGDPSSDSIVITVYRHDVLSIQADGKDVETIELDNTSKVTGTLPTDSQSIIALRQELGLIEYIGINADQYNWSSFSDGIRWVSDNPDAVGVYYQQGGLWNNIKDLAYETYLPQTQMAVSATAKGTATITATHAATGISDSVTVNVETLRDKFYLFQVSPAEATTLTYTNGDGEKRTVTTNEEGVLALYEPSGINSDVYFTSGPDEEPNLGTILKENLSSGERDAAKLQLYPLNTITLRPAAQAELYLLNPDGTPFANQRITLRGGVYLGGIYLRNAYMGSSSSAGSLQPGYIDNSTFFTDKDGKVTVYMDATQFSSGEYTGQLTNAALDYWFELKDLNNDKYYPTLVNIQGSMSPDYVLRTGSATVTLREVPEGQEEEPFLIAQTVSYGKASGDEDLQVRSVLGSTGTVGPNSTFKYAELTSRVMLWGVNNDLGDSTVTMTGSNGYAPEAQTVDVNTFPFASIPIITNTLVLTKETMTDSGWLKAATAESLKASVYQNGTLMKSMTMPFQVVDLTEVKLVDKDAEALVVDMTGRFMDGIGGGGSTFSFDSNKVSNAFNSDILGMLNDIQDTASPLFRVLITPTEDNSVFNVLVWGGYDSLDIDEFDYSQSGFAMDTTLREAELDVGVPPLNDLSDMAKGTYDPVGSVSEAQFMGTDSGLDIGAQLTGYYEGQFYFDTELGEWAFRALGGGMSAGASLSFQANVNAWAGPVPITATFAAGIALQLEFKAATVYKDQVDDTSGWTADALKADSVNDYLTTLRIQGYIDAFGGFGFDYSLIALKIGLFGRLSGDSTNTFLSRTYLKEGSQMNGQAVGVSGEVGIKFYAKFLFISYEAIIASGSFNYLHPNDNYTYIDKYWNGSSTSDDSFASLNAAPTLLSRSYLTAYANGQRTWNDPAFNSDATVVLDDANPGSEPKVNDDGSWSVYISDSNSENYFDSRIMAGPVGQEGTVISDGGYGDMSPSLSGSYTTGTTNITVATWVRLFDDLNKDSGEEISPAEQQQLLNSTEIMVATYNDVIAMSNNGGWEVKQLTNNASPDLAPVTAAYGTKAIVFWRSVSSTSLKGLTSEETRDAIQFSRYNYYNSYDPWSDPVEIYNGSLGSVVGMQAAMLYGGTAIVVFTLDRGSDDPNDPMKGYEIAYRTVDNDGNMSDLVVLTSDDEADTNPQVVAANRSYFVLGWYTTRDGGDIRLQAVGAGGELYSGTSDKAVPTSIRSITGEGSLAVSADFQFAKGVYQWVDGLTLVWAETEEKDGLADHSVLYGSQLCQIDNKMYLSSPQALITLPDRTLANSFSAWQNNNTNIRAYLFGTWYDPEKTEAMVGTDETGAEKTYQVPVDKDRLLTGGGTIKSKDVSVESIVVDYANLQTNSWTPVTFTIRNTGTEADDFQVTMNSDDAYQSDTVHLNPGERATLTVMYKTPDSIFNALYKVTPGSQYGNVYLQYHDIGISNMRVVEESAGDRTVSVTLYNDSAYTLQYYHNVEVSFYTDPAYTNPANITLVGSQAGVSASGNTVTIQYDAPAGSLASAALNRTDQGTLTFQVTYDLADYVTGTLGKEEVPASGVYLYAKAVVIDTRNNNNKILAEYANGNNEAAVQLTGAYARTGTQFTLNVDQGADVTGDTFADVTLRNNRLKSAATTKLQAVLLDGNGNFLEEQPVEFDATPLDGETERSARVAFSQSGSRVVVYPANDQDTLIFDGLNVKMSDFTADADGTYRYTLSNVTVPGTRVTAYAAEGTVTIAGENYGSGGSEWVGFSAMTNDTIVTIGSKTYVLTVNLAAGTVINAETPAISKSPASASYTQNDSAAALTVEATVTKGVLSYQWYRNTTNSNQGGTAIDRATQASYIPPTDTAGTVYYYCVVTNTDSSATGSKTATATTATAAITVTEPTQSEYTITFDPNNGTVDPTSALTTGGKLTSLPIPTRSGFTFDGWFTQAAGGTAVTTGTVFTQNTTIYAHWTEAAPTPQEYTITFHANGGMVTPASAETVNGKLTSLPTPTRNGFTFDGWFTQAAGGAAVTTGTVFTQNTTIYAHWTYSGGTQGGGSTGTATYRITVEPSTNGTVTANRTTASSGSTVTLTVKPDSGYHLNTLTVTRSNGTEVSLTDKGGGSCTFTMPAGAVTVKAVFAADAAGTLPFVDVLQGSWYYDGVVYAYEKGLMNGTSATTFSPDETTTRAMIATILWRLEGSPAADTSKTFDDVDPDSWYGAAVSWAAEEGIVNGYGDGKFGPDDPITREQMAAMLYRYAQYKKYDVSVGEDTNILSYTDFDQLSEWAIPAVQWACGSGVINGTSAATLSPGGSTTRSQAAVMLMRFCTEYVTW